MPCNVFDLSSLLVDHIRDILHLRIDNFPIRNIEQRREEDDGGSNEYEPPKRNNPDEQIA